MGKFDFLKNVSVDEAMKTLDSIKSGQEHTKKYIKNNPEKYRKFANLDPHKTKYRRKVYSIPAVVYWSDPEYWGQVALSKKLQKKHPEFAVKS